MAWNGYRAGRAAGGGALNGHVAPRAKQIWEIGNTVAVGFVKNLLISGKRDGEWKLVQIGTGKRYGFTPHMGLYAE